VVAALAARSGAEVIGITLQLYDYGSAVRRPGSCCAGQDIHDARAVAQRLGIAHYVFDYESRFRQSVIDRFADEYACGRTPIPCITCNQGVKFTDLLGLSRELGADCLATGHYVRRRMGPNGPELQRAADPARDQSYFLFATTREQLGFLRFPLGDVPKPAVREIARKLRLDVAHKPDSQDICFVPDGDYAAIVKKLRPETSTAGEVVDLEGRVLGRHEGLIHFTVGQRRGLNVGGQPAPLYVIRRRSGWSSARSRLSRPGRRSSATSTGSVRHRQAVSPLRFVPWRFLRPFGSTAPVYGSTAQNMASRRARRL
jgi:tRNA-specific 2-thiouridylase